MKIRALLETDYASVSEIYLHGIASGNATFEMEAPTWEAWDKNHLKACRLVAVDDHDQVMGWAALAPVSGRCVYAGVAELSVYVHRDFQGKGVGKRLLQVLVLESEKENLWTLQAGIFPENKASIKIHEQCGFRQVGYHERIGKMKNTWRDTILMERRSKVIGI
jgi:L-amino acid N-acyltransferase YncA